MLFSQRGMLLTKPDIGLMRHYDFVTARVKLATVM